MTVVVVTDSTASLPADLAAARGIVVVPLQVVIGSDVYDEGPGGATPELVAAAMEAHTPVSTSRPSPAVMLHVYEAAARAGATEIVSVHISADMSGTVESAQVAARRSPVPVTAVDSRQVGVATGYAALAAADVVDAGGSAAQAAAAARDRAAASSSLFYVDTLEHLRRGGRIGTAAALLGGALAVKPLLQIADGRVESLERVRTSGRALARLEELAVVAAGDSPVDVCVAHLASPDRAHQLTEHLTSRLVSGLGSPGVVHRDRCGPRCARWSGDARRVRLAAPALNHLPCTTPGPRTVVPRASYVGCRGPALAPNVPPMPSVPRRPGRPTAEHQAAVARRLDLLRAELAATPALRVVPDPAPEPSEAPETGHDPALDPWWSASTRIPGVADSVRVLPEPFIEPAEPFIEPADLAPVPDRLPLPGRHASRRRRDLVEALVPETLRGRVLIGPAQLTVVAVLVCLGLAVLAWSTVRSRPEVVAPPARVSRDDPAGGEAVSAAPVVALPSAAPSAVAASGAAAPAATSGGSITVDVAGKVRRPGIAVLASGARVVDAIAAAGGARQGVDLTPLNLARPLVDGEQIVVGIDPPSGVAAAALASTDPGGATSATAGALVDLNTATDAELDTLPDVGPVTAQSIITWREEHGGFTTVDELLEVSGIGEATLAKLAPHVTV